MNQGRRDYQSATDVGKAFASRIIRREFSSWMQFDSRQILDGIGEFGIVEPPKYHRAWVASVCNGIGMENRLHPAFQRGDLGRSRFFFRIFGRHLAILQHLDDALPRNHVASNIRDATELRQIELAFILVGRVATEAVFSKHKLLR